MVISWRFQRKFLYFILFWTLPVLLTVHLVRIAFDKEPTCFDQVQNNDEQGVDCGGSCELLCPFQVSEPREVWERSFYVADDVYNLVGYLENVNNSAGVKEAFYEFRVFGENDQLIGEPFVGKTFIGPTESSVVFVPGFKTNNQEPKRVSFRFLTDLNWHKTDPFFTSEFIKVKERKILDQDTLPRLEVVLENTSFFDFYDLPVIVILSDINGNAVAVSQTIVSFFPDTEEIKLFYTWPKPFGQEIVEIKVIPRVNPFSNYR